MRYQDHFYVMLNEYQQESVPEMLKYTKFTMRPPWIVNSGLCKLQVKTKLGNTITNNNRERKGRSKSIQFLDVIDSAATGKPSEPDFLNRRVCNFFRNKYRSLYIFLKLLNNIQRVLYSILQVQKVCLLLQQIVDRLTMSWHFIYLQVASSYLFSFDFCLINLLAQFCLYLESGTRYCQKIKYSTHFTLSLASQNIQEGRT